MRIKSNRHTITLSLGQDGSMRATASPGLSSDLAVKMMESAIQRIKAGRKMSKLVGPDGSHLPAAEAN